MRNKAIVHGQLDKLFVHSPVYSATMTFGNWLRDQINEARMSNAELARRVGVSATYIGNLIRDFSPNTKTGKGRPSEEIVESLARALNADVDDARLAAGYAPRYSGPPTTKAELIAALERIGVEQIEFEQDIEHSTPEELQELFDAVRIAVEVTLSRQGRKKQ